jgi:SNF2 family DNA or RNA helicase
LKLVEQRLKKRGIEYCYLDGSMSANKRKQQVEKFQAGDAPLFLISLKAGGTGLNLTAADYVLHLDPWWNPAVEQQASDRAHRLGQTRPVTVYRLIAKNTIEEKILELHEHKQALADKLLTGNGDTGQLSKDQLLALLAHQI